MKKKMKVVREERVKYKCCGLEVSDHGVCPECGWDGEGEDLINDVYGYKVNPSNFMESFIDNGMSYDEAMDLYNKSKEYIESTHEFVGSATEPTPDELDCSKLKPETIDRRFQ